MQLYLEIKLFRDKIKEHLKTLICILLTCPKFLDKIYTLVKYKKIMTLTSWMKIILHNFMVLLIILLYNLV